MRVLLVLLFLCGCNESATDDDIRAQVTLLLHQEGAPAKSAHDRLIQHGRRALPTVESAMHTAPPAGRKSLIGVLRAIGDEAAIPLLRHVAGFDPDEAVRREARWTLQGWANEGGARGEKAKAALRAVDETRQREEAG